ncbi:FecCD family ABC transporter permease [Microbulbifer harenosus]|uniref:Iron ABC transporter permease n=1 Tax=Microbulbifer harenosus TaxID=2576840 RepID=A0ABY2UHX7_9GAMM|nr:MULTISPECIES: iron ABC transporter permease [Microbulbifer]QIL91354.1 iron chelate uptake ABC transporter family permease subunit [Microbulbifer sp. SH-1]TLM77222.1 iron ABC transporter permease [Microbulbifer harenosus]
MEFRLSDKSLLPALVALLLLGSCVSLAVGAMTIGWRDVLAGLIHWSWPGFLELDVPEQYALVLGEIRLPRLVMGLMVGGTLGLCGAVMQGLFRNPLADPGIIGVSAGAGVGAAFVLVFASGAALTTFAGGIFKDLQWFLLPLAASLGGALSTWLVYRLGDRGKSVVMMLLAGVAINALAGAAIGLLNYVADDRALRDITLWQMGTLGGATWGTVAVSALVLMIGGALLWRRAPALNALLLGESEARHLGVDVVRLKQLMIVLTAIAMGAAVSAAGMIGFIGLVVPHTIRLLRGPDHRYLLPYSVLAGGLLLVLADTVARTLVAPAEMPVGIITALLGAPFFIYLLWQQRQQIF